MSDDDISHTIIAKSDQLNAEDLLAGPITVRVRDVHVVRSEREDQPVIVYYDGDNGRPFKPCKTMRRVLGRLWGKHSSKWVGKSMTLYNEPTVKWAGQEVGGIRISHMSHINGTQKMALSESKGKRKPTIIQPLDAGAPVQGAPAGAEQDRATAITNKLIERITGGENLAVDEKANEQIQWLRDRRPDLFERIEAAKASRIDGGGDGQVPDDDDIIPGDDDIPDDDYEGA